MEVHKLTRANDPYVELEDLVRHISRSLSDNPDGIVVQVARGDGFIHIEIRCLDHDVGALIGRRGANAEAMRTIVSAAAAARGIRATLQVIGSGSEMGPR